MAYVVMGLAPQQAFLTKRNGGLPPSAQRGGWALMSSRPGPVITHSR